MHCPVVAYNEGHAEMVFFPMAVSRRQLTRHDAAHDVLDRSN